MKIVWVTGASGFVGKNLLHQIPDDWLVYRISKTTYCQAENAITFNSEVPGCNLDKLPLPDIVIHLGASSNPRSIGCIKYNVEYTRLITEYLIRQRVKCTFVYASSINVYGAEDDVTTEYTATAPTTEYAASKAMCETMLAFYGVQNPDFKPRILRLPGIVGKGMTHGLVKDVVAKLRTDPNNLLLLGQDPGTYKTYIHIDDACQTIINAANGECPNVYTNVVYRLRNYRICAKEAAIVIAEEMKLNPTISFSGQSFVGDFSAPKIFNVGVSYWMKMKFDSSTEAFTQGVKDYICATS